MKKILLAALVLTFALPAFARDIYLGTTKLSYGRTDVDTLVIQSCLNERRDDRDRRDRRRDDRNDGRIRAFRFVVTNARADVNRIDVEYGNGMRDSFYVGREFGKQQSSPYYDLRGGARCVRTITVYGKTDKDIFKKSRLTFYGLE